MLFIGIQMLNSLMSTEETENKQCDCDDPCDDCSDPQVLTKWLKCQEKELDKPDDK